jgi:hypothetical protein
MKSWVRDALYLAVWLVILGGMAVTIVAELIYRLYLSP